MKKTSLKILLHSTQNATEDSIAETYTLNPQ